MRTLALPWQGRMPKALAKSALEDHLGIKQIVIRNPHKMPHDRLLDIVKQEYHACSKDVAIWPTISAMLPLLAVLFRSGLILANIQHIQGLMKKSEKKS